MLHPTPAVPGPWVRPLTAFFSAVGGIFQQLTAFSSAVGGIFQQLTAVFGSWRARVENF
jgi:hypothetical protein